MGLEQRKHLPARLLVRRAQEVPESKTTYAQTLFGQTLGCNALIKVGDKLEQCGKVSNFAIFFQDMFDSTGDEIKTACTDGHASAIEVGVVESLLAFGYSPMNLPEFVVVAREKKEA